MTSAYTVPNWEYYWKFLDRNGKRLSKRCGTPGASRSAPWPSLDRPLCNRKCMMVRLFSQAFDCSFPAEHPVRRMAHPRGMIAYEVRFVPAGDTVPCLAVDLVPQPFILAIFVTSPCLVWVGHGDMEVAAARCRLNSRPTWTPRFSNFTLRGFENVLVQCNNRLEHRASSPLPSLHTKASLAVGTLPIFYLDLILGPSALFQHVSRFNSMSSWR
ncbi:hypothetical protein B0T09DRAFT_21947 [Sordaria sp. MPI-SDFR-AT-0083]|nr:hypothetical protein B0T09DRAFT_21947 [Sordaria sp. MPI-SDFR-AT-0083]